MNSKYSNETYIIAEIGQNHNGDIGICKALIDQLVEPLYDSVSNNRLNSINAVKLIKRDLDEELSAEMMDKPYDSIHSFGKTFREHRQVLELSYKEHCEISDYAHSKGIDFIDTLCSPKTADLLAMTKIDKVKIASRDICNIPLLKKIAQNNADVILSIGMAGEEELSTALDIVDAGGKNEIGILHCLSQYPACFDRLNLNSIQKLKDRFGNRCTIGYSDHSLGIHIPLAAVAMGAEIIEKHVTFDKTMKGTDQACSAEPQEMRQLVYNIRTLEQAFGTHAIFRDEVTTPASIKLGRSLASKVDMRRGDIIRESDIHMISPGNGLKWNMMQEIVGKKLIKDMPMNTLIDMESLQ